MSAGAQTPTQLRYGLMAKLRYPPHKGEGDDEHWH